MKRFTNTCKWDNPVFRALTGTAKNLLVWLNDHCDNAGIIVPDLEGAAFDIRESVNKEHLIELKPWLKEISPGTYWIDGFIFFQFGNVPPPGTSAKMAPLHLTIWNSLAAHNLTYTNPKNLARQMITDESPSGGLPITDPSTPPQSSLVSKGEGKGEGNTRDRFRKGKQKEKEVYILIQEWKRLYFPVFRCVYADKKRDWSAAKNLLKSTGLTPEKIIFVASEAMRRSGPKFWACENRTQEFSDFCNSWNRINAELNGHQVTTPDPLKPVKSGVERYGE